jgi:hypothetical protein
LNNKKSDHEKEITRLQRQTEQVAQEMNVQIKILKISNKKAEHIAIEKELLFL